MVNSNTCLLKLATVGGFLLANDAELEGSYLHFNREDGCWVRSGKAVGNNALNPVNGLVQ